LQKIPRREAPDSKEFDHPHASILEEGKMAEQINTMQRRDSAPRAPRSPAKVIKYGPPNEEFAGKAVIRLVQSDILFGNVQVIREGGDNNLHSHAGMDGFWFVLKGNARFYGPTDDEVIAELGPHQGVFIPRNFAYWFEKIGDEELEILQVEAIDRSVRNVRTDHTAIKSATAGAVVFDMDGKLLSRGYAREP
jgi:mannose-6-phosphate isomerase-like protein (cupin superfamily)